MAHTVRRLALFAGVTLAILAGARCNDDDNTVAGPGPPPQATATPAPPGAPTPTPTPPPPANPVVDVGANGGNTFVDRQSGTSTTTIRAGNTVHWIWVSGVHSTTSGSCTGGPCQPDGLWDSGSGTGMTFDRTFLQPGTFPYYCTVHGSMMQGTVVVQ